MKTLKTGAVWAVIIVFVVMTAWAANITHTVRKMDEEVARAAVIQGRDPLEALDQYHRNAAAMQKVMDSMQ